MFQPDYVGNKVGPQLCPTIRHSGASYNNSAAAAAAAAAGACGPQVTSHGAPSHARGLKIENTLPLVITQYHYCDVMCE